MTDILQEVYTHYKCMVLLKANGRNIHTLNNKLCIVCCCLDSKRPKHKVMLNETLNWIFRETGVLVDFEWYTKETP